MTGTCIIYWFIYIFFFEKKISLIAVQRSQMPMIDIPTRLNNALNGKWETVGTDKLDKKKN